MALIKSDTYKTNQQKNTVTIKTLISHIISATFRYKTLLTLDKMYKLKSNRMKSK